MTKKENVRERRQTGFENKYVEEKQKGNQERKYRKKKAK